MPVVQSVLTSWRFFIVLVCELVQVLFLGLIIKLEVFNSHFPVTTLQWRTQKFFSGGIQQIQLTEGRENRDLGAVAPQSGVPPNLQVGETCILIMFLRCIFHGTGNSAQLCQNFGIIWGGGGFEPPKPTLWVRQCYPWTRSVLRYYFCGAQ
jgi:hypothetical protein